MPAIDFSKVEGLKPVPVDQYPATISAAAETESNAGNQMINLQWKIEGGEYDGRIVFDSMVFTEKSMFRIKNTMLALGFPKDFKGDVVPDLLIGKSAIIAVEIETSTQLDESGEPYPPRNRVKKVISLDRA